MCISPDKCHCHTNWGGDECNVVPGEGLFRIAAQDMDVQKEKMVREKELELKAEKKRLKRLEDEAKVMYTPPG